MRSRTSYFNAAVFRGDLLHYWPLTAGYTLLWLLLLPLSRLTVLSHADPIPAARVAALRETLEIAVEGGYVIAFLCGILFAMAVLSYLANPRATNGLHALPARRETLYLTHWLAGLLCQLAPQLLAALLTAAVLGSYGVFDARICGLALLGMLLPTVFFFSFGMFCMVFAGQILAAPVFYFVLNVLVAGVELLLRTFAGNFLYGWTDSGDAALGVLSPIYPLLAGDISTRMQEGVLRIRGLGLLFAYDAAGLAFTALGLLVYRRRHSEATGSTVAVGWARPVFKYGVAFCAALSVGQLFYYLFFGQFRDGGDASLPGTLACMAAAGLLGYFGAEMLLRKSVRVWASAWRGAAVVAAVLVVVGCALSFDLTGYESYVPGPEQIESADVSVNVYLGGGGAYGSFRDPETLRLITEAHRAVVSEGLRERRSGEGVPAGVTADAMFTVTYRMRDGRTVSRRYDDVVLSAAQLGDPASAAATLNELYNAPEVVSRRVLDYVGKWYGDETDPRAIPGLRFTGGCVNVDRYDGDVYLYGEVTDLSPAEAQRLYDAILRDIDAGHAAGSLFADNENLFWVELYATRPYDGERRDTDTIYPTPPAPDADGRASVTFHPALTARMTEALAVLRELGVEPRMN